MNKIYLDPQVLTYMCSFHHYIFIPILKAQNTQLFHLNIIQNEIYLPAR